MTTGIAAGYFTDPRDSFAEFCRIRQYGYDGIDLQCFISADHPIYSYTPTDLKTVADAAADAGIFIAQVHSRWECPPVCHNSAEGREELFASFATATRGCEHLGSHRLVVHPVMPNEYFERRETEMVEELNCAFFDRLCTYAADFGVTVCLENMPFEAITLAKTPDILRIVKQVDRPNFRVCLDTGHACIHGRSPAEDVRLLGNQYLAALHVHDNDGHSDQHLPPSLGIIDWRDFSSALREIGFTGTFSLETHAVCEKDAPQTVRDEAETALCRAARALADGTL